MASCQTNRWVANSAPYVKLVVEQNGHDGTTATLVWTLYYISDYPAEAGSRNYTVSIAGSTVASGVYNINGVTGTKVIASGTKVINKTHSTQKISFGVSFNFAIAWSGVYAGTLSASSSISVTPKFSYTISYNANGGSGAPSAQTKWHGETLTLSSTKPTKSGYTFVGWGTSTTDTSANWTAGGSYTANSGRTLYAIWKKTITLTYDANGGSGPPSAQSATVYNATTSNKFTISSTKPTRTGYKFLGWSKSSSATSASYSAGGNITLSSSDTLYAVWSLITYTVTYNANGGTNAPSSQTKKYGTDLKLSSTKPTRSGYNFLGWATSSSATSAAYSAGGVYKTNANLSLYAVWKRATFTVTYDTNGGSGGPSSQTKTYGTDLTLSSTEPTRKYHAFKGWATSKTATVPTYRAGGVYKTNADVKLYAVWEVTYLIPRITNASVTRCNEEGNPQDDGTYALVKFKWATDEDVSTIKIYWKKSTSTSYGNSDGVTATGRSGSVSHVVGDGGISEDSAYNFKINVVDSTDSNSATRTLGNTQFPIDLLSGGQGVTIGGVATKAGFVSKWHAYFENSAYFEKNAEFNGATKFNNTVEINSALTINQNVKFNSGNKTSVPIYIWDGDANGHGMAIGAGGAVVIGGGESAKNFVDDMALAGTTEQTYITSDNNIYLYTNCNTIGEKLLVLTLNTYGNVVVNKHLYLANNNSGLYMRDTSGTDRTVAFINASDVLAIGHGMYSANIGKTTLYGNEIHYQSNSDHYFYQPIALENNKGLYMRDADGTYRDLFRINTSNMLQIGYGMYSGKVGETRLFGGTKLRFYTNDGEIYSDSSLIFNNNKNIYHLDKGGTARRTILYDNNNQLVLGYDQLASAVGNTYVDGNLLYLRSNGAIYANGSTISTSDEREKENIVPLGTSSVATYGLRNTVDIHSELFDRLRPVQFNYINRTEARTCFGLIAQDVLAALEELGFAEDELDLVYGGVDTGEHTDRYGISYQNFTALLIHEVQKLKMKVMTLEAERN